MVSPLPRWNRRSLIMAAVAGAGIPTVARAGQTPIPFEVLIDPALLEPATEPANWEVEKDYSTETVPAAEPTDYCDLKLYPFVPDATLAISGVMQASDLNATPNLVLVQEFRYADAETAGIDYSGVVHEVQTLASRKLYMSGIEGFTAVRESETESLVTYTAPNGATYALLALVQHDRVLVLRAGSNGADPTPGLEQIAAMILGSAPATPAGGENANVELDWEIENWHWSYGPIDIHPYRYFSPVCV